MGTRLDWVLIPELVLPVGRFNKATSKLLFRLPVGYPQTGPDNFFVDGHLRLKDGSNPPGFNVGSQSSSGPAPLEGSWGWFSWHPQVWRPAASIDGGDNTTRYPKNCKSGDPFTGPNALELKALLTKLAPELSPLLRP